MLLVPGLLVYNKKGGKKEHGCKNDDHLWGGSGSFFKL